jgi:staphylococcal nuclease domain-containing protein 1
VVKAIRSGDTIVVIHLEKTQQGPPTEREITLSNINAPRIGRPKTQKKDPVEDEAFAWGSREFLRKKAIGKQVIYTIEHKTPTNKEYGVVGLVNPKTNEPEDLAKLIVAEGWAKVRRPTGKDVRPEVEEFIKLEDEARKAEKGIFAKVATEDEINATKRSFEDYKPTELFERLRGKPQNAVIEKVRNGSTLQVTLVPEFFYITVLLSGVECPAVSPDGKESEAFGREAKFFTEHFLLNRDVQVIIEGVDKYNFYGTVNYEGKNIAEELLKAGLGRYVDWSGARTAFADKLRAAEKGAKERRQRLWANFSGEPKMSKQEEKKSKTGKEFTGKVVKVINGQSIKISDSHHEFDIYLSSIKVPRQGNFSQNDNESRAEAIARTWAWEAREYLRKRLIGQRVRCVLDYVRPAFKDPKNNQKEFAERPCYSVYVDKNNVAVELVEAGFAQAQEHKGGEQRSREYELILFAESRAKKLQKGMWTPADRAPVTMINDLSQDVSKARQFLAFLKRNGRQRGVVEYVFSGSKYKLFVPKEGCMIVLSLAAVKTPRSNPPEPLAKESTQFAQSRVMQHDIEFEVTSQDKGGNFIGTIWTMNKENLGALILEEGLGFIQQAALKENPNSTELLIAEDVAKKAKKGIWHDYDEAAEEEKRKRRQAQFEESRAPKQEFIDVIVTEIVDATKFYVQVVGPEGEQLEELMKALATAAEQEKEANPSAATPAATEDNNNNAAGAATGGHKANVNELVRAQFTADDAWYRGKVIKKTPEGEYTVLYIDYGNTETIPESRLRKLDQAFQTLKPQAQEAQLAYILPPAIDEDWGQEAAEFLKELVWGKTMMANVEYRGDNGKLYLSLGDRESQVHVNAALLRAGLARVERLRGRHLQAMYEKLKEEEDKARANHSYIWEYGDPGSDEEDDRPAKPATPTLPAKGKK